MDRGVAQEEHGCGRDELVGCRCGCSPVAGEARAMFTEVETVDSRLPLMKKSLVVASLIVLLAGAILGAQDGPSAKQLAQERAQAEREVPELVEVLGVARGVTVADVGAGLGAMTVRK